MRDIEPRGPGVALRRGLVFLRDLHIGNLEEIPGGRFRFSYLPGVPPEWYVSLTLPVRSEPYESRGLHPFFAGLLPSGVPPALQGLDSFGLLLALGADPSGAVRVFPPQTDLEYYLLQRLRK